MHKPVCMWTGGAFECIREHQVEGAQWQRRAELRYSGGQRMPAAARERAALRAGGSPSSPLAPSRLGGGGRSAVAGIATALQQPAARERAGLAAGGGADRQQQHYHRCVPAHADESADLQAGRRSKQ